MQVRSFRNTFFVSLGVSVLLAAEAIIGNSSPESPHNILSGMSLIVTIILGIGYWRAKAAATRGEVSTITTRSLKPNR